MRMPSPCPLSSLSMPEALAPTVLTSLFVHHLGHRAAAAQSRVSASTSCVRNVRSGGRGLIRLACALAAGGGVAVAVVGMLRLSLSMMLAGSGFWFLSVLVWELATGRFR